MSVYKQDTGNCHLDHFRYKLYSYQPISNLLILIIVSYIIDVISHR